jgi:hypothetical protein
VDSNFNLGRFFKKIIYLTNHRRPEKDLLTKENIRQTLRLILADAFTQTEADLNVTHIIKELYSSCGVLFSSLLPPSEQMSVEARDIDNEDDDEWVLQDGKHLRPMVTGCIQAKYCHDTLGLPTRSSNMSDTFSKALSIAYGNEYNMPDIVIFSNSRFQWCKKLSFSDPYI